MNQEKLLIYTKEVSAFTQEKSHLLVMKSEIKAPFMLN